jgi:hypothetical protein
MPKKKAKNKVEKVNDWTDPAIGMTIIEKGKTVYEPVIEEVIHRIPGTDKKVDIPATDILEAIIKNPVKFIQPVMPPTSEIFSIKDQGNSKLVIKKDGTKLTIPK